MDEPVQTFGTSSSNFAKDLCDYIPSKNMDKPYVNLSNFEDPNVPAQKGTKGVIIEEGLYGQLRNFFYYMLAKIMITSTQLLY